MAAYARTGVDPVTVDDPGLEAVEGGVQADAALRALAHALASRQLAEGSGLVVEEQPWTTSTC